MTKKEINKTVSYSEYLNSLNKGEITKILDVFHIEYKKNQKKQVYITLVFENLNQIVDYCLDVFQTDEFHNIKLVVKKKGKITIRINPLLLSFMKNLERNKLVIEISPKSYVMPKEILDIFKKKLKNKGPIKTTKVNTREYNLILGIIDAYGAIDFNKFYDFYAKDYKLTKDKALERVKRLANFYNEFRLIEDNKKCIIASVILKNQKNCNQILNKKHEYAIYTNEEFINIHNLSYMNKYKSYKKLIKFIKRNYYVEKRNFKIVNNKILIPFLAYYQVNKEDSLKELSTLIDLHFEFNNHKHKNKFMSLIEKMADDYPSWELKGYSKRGKI